MNRQPGFRWSKWRRVGARCRACGHSSPGGELLRFCTHSSLGGAVSCFRALVARRRGAPFCTQSSLGSAKSCFWELVAQMRRAPLLHVLVSRGRCVVLSGTCRTSTRCVVSARSRRSEARGRSSGHSSPESDVLRFSRTCRSEARQRGLCSVPDAFIGRRREVVLLDTCRPETGCFSLFMHLSVADVVWLLSVVVSPI